MRIEIKDQIPTDDRAFFTLADGHRGLVRFSREEVRQLADLLASFQTR